MKHLDDIIDLFVEKVNSSCVELLEEEEVPIFLREGDTDEHGEYHWRVRRKDFSSEISDLEKKLTKTFPASYRSLISRYAFPAFEIGPIMLWANTGEGVYWELTKKLFVDNFMSQFLLQRGFLQFGNPNSYNYDSICFDCSRAFNKEYPVVQLDHEAILCNSKIKIVKEISTSFLDFATGFIN